ncbi:MAG: tetratricopeptide repeat protein [bacterium]
MKRYLIYSLGLSLVVLLWTGIYFIQSTIDTSFSYQHIEKMLYVPSGKFLKPLCLGFDELVADILWIKAIGYFGTHVKTDRNYPWLYHILDLITTLDPLFRYPYEFGAIIFSMEADNVHQSISILRKGIKNYPDYWRFYFYLGFDYYFILKEPTIAADYIAKAATLPGHPTYLPKLAASLYAVSQGKDTALIFLKQIYQNTEDEQIRRMLEKKMKDIEQGKLPSTLLKHLSD